MGQRSRADASVKVSSLRVRDVQPVFLVEREAELRYLCEMGVCLFILMFNVDIVAGLAIVFSRIKELRGLAVVLVVTRRNSIVFFTAMGRVVLSKFLLDEFWVWDVRLPVFVEQRESPSRLLKTLFYDSAEYVFLKLSEVFLCRLRLGLLLFHFSGPLADKRLQVPADGVLNQSINRVPIAVIVRSQDL